MTKSFGDVGLPPNHEVISLAYHVLSRTLIAHISPLASCPFPKRLFFRSQSALVYQPVAHDLGQASIDSFTLDPQNPVLYFLTNTWREVAGHQTRGFPDKLYRFRLDTHECENLIQCMDLQPPKGYKAAWLNSLLCVTDGNRVSCEGSFQQMDGQVDHLIIELALSNMALTPQMRLEAVFA